MRGTSVEGSRNVSICFFFALCFRALALPGCRGFLVRQCDLALSGLETVRHDRGPVGWLVQSVDDGWISYPSCNRFCPRISSFFLSAGFVADEKIMIDASRPK